MCRTWTRSWWSSQRVAKKKGRASITIEDRISPSSNSLSSSFSKPLYFSWLDSHIMLYHTFQLVRSLLHDSQFQLLIFSILLWLNIFTFNLSLQFNSVVLPKTNIPAEACHPCFATLNYVHIICLWVCIAIPHVSVWALIILTVLHMAN